MTTTYPASKEIQARVFAALEREADLDDVVTASEQQIADLIGVSQQTVSCAVVTLIDSGRVVHEGFTGRRNTTRILRLVYGAA